MKYTSLKPFAVLDIDGTLIRWQLFHAVVENLAKSSPPIHETIKHLRKPWKNRSNQQSFKTYEQELISIFWSLTKEISSEEFTKAVDNVFKEYKDQVYTYTRDLIRELKRKDYLLFAISGSHTEVVERIAEYYGFDDFIGAVFEQKDGRFTGKFRHDVRNKQVSLKKLMDKHRVGFKGSLGVGDSKNDAAFLDLVDQPIAFNPDKELFNIARAKGWKIAIERKNVVYELESKHGKYVLGETGKR